MPPSPVPPPRTCRIPGSMSPHMVFDLLRLVRPPVDGPAGHGRTMIQDAMGMLETLNPRDVVEVMFVLQIIAMQCAALRTNIDAAAHEHDPAMMMRIEKHGLALQRAARSMERRLQQHRRRLKARGELREAPPMWEYDLAALESAWRRAPVKVDLLPHEVGRAIGSRPSKGGRPDLALVVNKAS